MDSEESCKSRPKVVKEERIRAIINGDNSHGDSPNLDFSTESDVPDGVGEVERLRSSEAIGSPQAVEAKIWDGGMSEAESSTPRSSHSPSSSVKVTGFKPAQMKGLGLRKWRRMRRDSSNDGASNADSAQFLKRRLPTTEFPVNHEESKLNSVVEAEAADVTRNTEMTSFPISTGVLDSELEVLASSGFSIGMDSDNSEDRSSKASMAGSAPRPWREAHGFGRERPRVKNFSGRGSSQVLQQHGQRRGGTADASRKFREDYVRLEKVHTHSSAESDLRSSASEVLRQSSVVNSNGIHSDKPLNFGGDHSTEAQTKGDIQPGYCKENIEMKILTRDGLHDELEEDAQDRKNCHPPADPDPFMESIMLLQEAHKSLEDEILKIRTIGKEPMFDDTDSQLEGTEASNSPTVDAHFKGSYRRVEQLESLLDEASSTIKAKDETVLGKACLQSIEVSSTDHFFHQVHQQDLETQLEALVKKSMEAEIEYLILTRTSQNWKILAEDHIALLKEQRSLTTDHEQVMLNHRNFEERIFKLKDESEKLKAYCEGLVGTQKVLRLQSKVCKVSLRYIVQLLLLCISFRLFLMQLLPQPNESVPT